MPKSVFTRSLQVMYAYRPQVTFLGLVPDRGECKPLLQPSLARAIARKAAEEKEQSNITAKQDAAKQVTAPNPKSPETTASHISTETV